MTAEELSDSLSKKSRFYRVKRHLEFFGNGQVGARISKIRVAQQEKLFLVFEGTKAAPILTELKSRGLATRRNTHLGAFLLDNVASE